MPIDAIIQNALEGLRHKKSDQEAYNELMRLKSHSRESSLYLLKFLEDPEMRTLYGLNKLALEILLSAPAEAGGKVVEYFFKYVKLDDKVAAALRNAIRVHQGIPTEVFLMYGKASLKYLTYAGKNNSSYQNMLSGIREVIKNNNS